MTYAQYIARALDALERCQKVGNTEWELKHKAQIDDAVSNHLPSGSGWDQGTKLDYDTSYADMLVFTGSFHHMTGTGMYDGWTDHKIIVTPSLAFGFTVRVTGRDRNDVKNYLADIFDHALREPVPEPIDSDGPAK